MAKKVMGPGPKKAAKTGTQVVGPVYNATKRAPLMNVNLTKGYKMSVDTTSMNKPDEKTFNFSIMDSSGKVIRKGNLSKEGSMGKTGARETVSKLKAGIGSKVKK